MLLLSREWVFECVSVGVSVYVLLNNVAVVTIVVAIVVVVVVVVVILLVALNKYLYFASIYCL